MKFAPEHMRARCTLQQENPKRGTSAARYDRYKCATSLQMVLDLGGSRGDLANDIIKGFIHIEGSGTKRRVKITRNGGGFLRKAARGG